MPNLAARSEWLDGSPWLSLRIAKTPYDALGYSSPDRLLLEIVSRTLQ